HLGGSPALPGIQDIRHGRPQPLPSGGVAGRSSPKKCILLLCGEAKRSFPQRDRVQDHVGPRVLWSVWEQLAAEAKALMRGRAPLPVLFEHCVAARASFLTAFLGWGNAQ